MAIARSVLSVLSKPALCVLVMFHAANATDLPAQGLYELVIETEMPHLKENLRYSIRREERCLGPEQIFSAFPALASQPLRHCTLTDERRENDARAFTLSCPGSSGTTGRAFWRVEAHRLTGSLEVKMGGKNMTFSERVTLRFLGECSSRRSDTH